MAKDAQRGIYRLCVGLIDMIALGMMVYLWAHIDGHGWLKFYMTILLLLATFHYPGDSDS